MVAEALFLLPCMGGQAPPTTTSGHIKSKEAFVFQNYRLTHPYNYGPLLSLLRFSRRSAINRWRWIRQLKGDMPDLESHAS